ncbi:MAG: hypothetical protein R3B09_06600 [Nannocystaceae bacterium]
MSTDPRRVIVGRLRPLAVRLYAESRRWIPIPVEGERFWLFRHPEERLRQLQIPMDADDVGFVDAMLDVVRRLAEIERRSIDAVLADLQWPDADILRVRVQSRESEAGQLSLSADVDLREGARRALLAAACSVINPARFHPRLSRSEADALLSACRAGQTEVGSYVVKLICPLHAVDEPDDVALPFTRQATTYLMRATSELVTRIEQSRLHEYERDEADGAPLSWNLCDALLRMSPEREAGQIELAATWAADRRIAPPSPAEAPSRVSIKAEYLPEIEQVARILRPTPSTAREEQLIGTVEQLAGAVGADGRRSGRSCFRCSRTGSRCASGRAWMRSSTRRRCGLKSGGTRMSCSAGCSTAGSGSGGSSRCGRFSSSKRRSSLLNGSRFVAPPCEEPAPQSDHPADIGKGDAAGRERIGSTIDSEPALAGVAEGTGRIAVDGELQRESVVDAVEPRGPLLLRLHLGPGRCRRLRG